MRLYLSSFRLGNQPRRLVDLVAPTAANSQALVIANACDLLSEDDRKPRVERELLALGNLGFRAEEFDLRRYFRNGSDQTELRAELASACLVWARGGNAFVLLRAMRRSGFATALTDALDADSLVYGGYSGGIAVLAPSLRGIETVNDPLAIPEGSDAAIPWEGLDIIPYSLAPHYKSNHPASKGIDEVVRYFKAHHMPFKTLRDGEVRIISGTREELVS